MNTFLLKEEMENEKINKIIFNNNICNSAYAFNKRSLYFGLHINKERKTYERQTNLKQPNTNRT